MKMPHVIPDLIRNPGGRSGKGRNTDWIAAYSAMTTIQCPSINGYFHLFRRWAQILILEIPQYITAVKIIARLEFHETISFTDRH
ncbi:MAG: hypothetical protein COZ11_10205 [Deltaproteobacteria bacterium CG_4_10_14_3_um_filter_51_14]|nr:MAG: hypothetical protein COZ11_10205 [Deltaproteobacteria bacterium CG_4_10_14_3_um_filter_51_14]